MVWNDRLSVGVARLDKDHKKLLAVLNEMYALLQRGSAGEVLDDVLESLVDYTRRHFENEERLLIETRYPDLEVHKLEHEKMVAWLNQLRSRRTLGTAAGPSLETVNYLKDWLFDHILGSDQRYSAHLHAHGIR